MKNLISKVRSSAAIKIGLTSFAILLLIVLFLCFYTVGPGQRGVLMTFNKVQEGVELPGAHLKIPFAQTVETMNVRVMKYGSTETAASKDLQDATTGVVVIYQLIAPRVDNFFVRVGTIKDFEHNVLNSTVSNTVKVVTARYNAEQLVTDRDSVRDAIDTEIRSALKGYDIDIKSINITDFRFGDKFADAIEDKQVAYQESLKAEYVLEKVETDAQQQVKKAEANAKATRLNAEADAYAYKLKNKELTQNLVEMSFIEKWDGKLPTTLTQGLGEGPVPFLNVNQ